MSDKDSTIRDVEISQDGKNTGMMHAESGGEAFPAGFDIRRGGYLLDLYYVDSDAIEGGMGRVFKVRHEGWGVELALKQPHANLFETKDQKQMFVHECEAWIGLGLHPHIVSCYYVREIGGVPSVFSEWMDGGSLKDWIADGRLYAGDEAAQLTRILDIAIQYVRGLCYAHENTLIHQDVKPDNLMLTAGGTAKVADFGIAQARVAAMTGEQNVAEGGTILSAGGGYTPAYCSPEQMNRTNLTRRTDIWSWAVTVLEMLLGERLWQNGVVAGRGCADYLQEARLAVPDTLKKLLLRCFEEDETQRPHDFTEIEAALLYIYREVAGGPYGRAQPKAAADTADSLNNRALSLVDIGKGYKAGQKWNEALAADKENLNAKFNRSVYYWRGGFKDDDEILDTIKIYYDNAPDNEDCIWAYANFCLERCDYETAAELAARLKNSGTYAMEAQRVWSFARVRQGAGMLDLQLQLEEQICFSSDGKVLLAASGAGIRRFEDGQLRKSSPWKATFCVSAQRENTY